MIEGTPKKNNPQETAISILSKTNVFFVLSVLPLNILCSLRKKQKNS